MIKVFLGRSCWSPFPSPSFTPPRGCRSSELRVEKNEEKKLCRISNCSLWSDCEFFFFALRCDTQLARAFFSASRAVKRHFVRFYSEKGNDTAPREESSTIELLEQNEKLKNGRKSLKGIAVSWRPLISTWSWKTASLNLWRTPAEELSTQRTVGGEVTLRDFDKFSVDYASRSKWVSSREHLRVASTVSRMWASGRRPRRERLTLVNLSSQRPHSLSEVLLRGAIQM